MLLKNLFEQIETRTVDDVWSEIGSSASSYTPSQVFYVRPSDDKPGEMDVYIEDQHRRTLHSSVSKQEFNSTFEVIRKSDQPDAEGFSKYRYRESMEAAQYTGDPVNLESDGALVRLKKGDYVVRAAKGNDFTYSVEGEKFFNDGFIKS